MGNVLAVITPDASDATQPAIERLTDYYPFGMEMGGRSYKSNDYRFGYTGHEKENDLAEGVYTMQYRLLDTRLGRWMSVDPLFGKYPDMSAYNYCGGNPVVMVDSDGRGMNGGITFVNNSKETIYLGNASGQKQNGKEVNMNGLVELTPGAKLEPMVLLEKGKETEGVVWAAKLTTIERDENGNEVKNEDGTPKTKVRYIYAYDVDYIQLQEGQTLILKNKLRFNTNEKDKDAKTPVSTWTVKLYNSDDPSHRDHTKYGDLKVRRALTGGGTITFTDGDKSGEIKCDTDNGKGTGSNRINFFEPCIYPELHSLPHNSSENEKNTK